MSMELLSYESQLDSSSSIALSKQALMNFIIRDLIVLHSLRGWSPIIAVVKQILCNAIDRGPGLQDGRYLNGVINTGILFLEQKEILKHNPSVELEMYTC